MPRQGFLRPALFAFRPPLTAGTALLHRLTALCLTVGVPFVTWWLGAAAKGPEAYAEVVAFFRSWPGTLLLFAWTWALFFHLSNGIRHMAWHWGAGLAKAAVTRSGYGVLATASALTVLAWTLGGAVL